MDFEGYNQEMVVQARSGKSSAADMSLLGGNLSLDFLNTVDWRTSDQPEELLRNYDDFLVWAERVGVLKRSDGKPLPRSLKRHPQKARLILARLRRLRELLYRLFTTYLQEIPSAQKDIHEMNRWLRWMANHRRISAVPKAGFHWDWKSSAMHRPLLEILWAASELMTSKEMKRVQQCGGPGCGWLFLDSSRNRTRRWCSMKACGNRAKARSFYHRKKKR